MCSWQTCAFSKRVFDEDGLEDEVDFSDQGIIVFVVEPPGHPFNPILDFGWRHSFRALLSTSLRLGFNLHCVGVLFG